MMMNKRFTVVIITLMFLLAMATVARAEDIIVPTDPNSGTYRPGPNTPVDNSMMTTPISPSRAPDKITIMVNGKEVKSDVPPYETEGRVMVPYRFVAEALGCKVDWDGGFYKVTATKGESVIWMIIDMKVININGQNKRIDVPPVLREGRTFVPVRFMSEALGYKVSWNENTNTVYINE